jgi:hypothetical protein
LQKCFALRYNYLLHIFYILEINKSKLSEM